MLDGSPLTRQLVMGKQQRTYCCIASMVRLRTTYGVTIKCIQATVSLQSGYSEVTVRLYSSHSQVRARLH